MHFRHVEEGKNVSNKPVESIALRLSNIALIVPISTLLIFHLALVYNRMTTLEYIVAGVEQRCLPRIHKGLSC